MACRGWRALREIAAALGIRPSCVSSWRRRLRETGALAPDQVGGHRPRELAGETGDWLRTRVAEGAFTTCGLVTEMAARGIKTDRRAVWVFLHARGLSSKQKRAARRAGPSTHRPDAARWKAPQGRVNPRHLVFLDETWIKTNMAPLRGWGPCGRRLAAKVPHGHWKTLTFIAALRHDRVNAPCVLDGPVNGEAFTACVEQVLVPTLSPSDIVVLDNLGSHKGQRAPAVPAALQP